MTSTTAAWMDGVLIEATTAAHIEGFRQSLDHVARERRFIAAVEAPSLEETTAFVSWLLNGAGLQYVAVTATGQVVGWCDIIRNHREGFRHSGQLGMGVVAAFRRAGIGRRLAQAAIAHARAMGLTRVELEVFASNRAAIVLYASLGFQREGVKRGAREIDGAIDDVVLMALHLPEAAP